MAKFLAPYSLCPLIEHKNFLGVSDDGLSDCVIVTLSRNMVIRFRLSDQKQLSSWGTRNKLTAPVVYDHFNNRFIGVFNGDEIAFWQNSLEQLNKVKKYKYTWLIHSIVSSKDVPPHIVYMNGSIASLCINRETRKEPTGEDFLQATENIEEVKIVNIVGEYYIMLYTYKVQGEMNIYFIPVSDNKEKITIQVSRDENVKLLGHTVIDSEVSSALITFWSNGDLNAFELPPDKTVNFPGRRVGNLTEINPEVQATLFPISSEQLAIHGAEAYSEGGIIAVYSIKFGLIESMEKLKVYNTARKALLRSREFVIPVGPNLLVLPYNLFCLRLAGLIGSQAEVPKGTLEELLSQGLPESRVCELLMPGLIEKKNTKGVLELLDRCQEMPDLHLISALVYALSQKPSDLREAIIQNALSKTLVGDINSLAFLRSYITLQQALQLLHILSDMISDKPGDRIPLEWSALLLDSHFQQYLLSRDKDVLEAMRKVSDSVACQLEYADTLKVLHSDLKNLKKGKTDLKKPMVPSQNYVIETIQLY